MSSGAYIYGYLKFVNETSNNTITINTPNTLNPSYSLTLPINSGLEGQTLINSSTPGILTWQYPTLQNMYNNKNSITPISNNTLINIDMTGNSVGDVFTYHLQATAYDNNIGTTAIFDTIRTIKKTGISTLSENITTDIFKNDDWYINNVGSIYSICLTSPAADLKYFNIILTIQTLIGNSPSISFSY
jgi:hypothetical protein